LFGAQEDFAKLITYLIQPPNASRKMRFWSLSTRVVGGFLDIADSDNDVEKLGKKKTVPTIFTHYSSYFVREQRPRDALISP
jgi:hypothetical protein